VAELKTTLYEAPFTATSMVEGRRPLDGPSHIELNVMFWLCFYPVKI
jgi:hypothetical protein